jgi:hypothetical protein
MRKALVMFGAAVLALAPLAANAAIVEFDDPFGAGGTISYDGSTVLSGSGIPLQTITGKGTPVANGATLVIQNGSLNFTTGTILTEPGVGSSGYTWNGGGSFTITGSVAALGLSGTLLSGTFLSPVSALPTVLPVGSLLVFSGYAQSTLVGQLAQYFGIAGDGSLALTGISFGVPNAFAPDGSFSLASTNTDVDFFPVPVPAALPLFLTALAGIGVIARRRAA